MFATDVLIIGTGIAGCSAALNLARQGLAVTLVTRTRKPEESNTYYAQGGIIYRGSNDSPDLLSREIVAAGDALNYQPAVDILASEGPDLVKSVLLDDLEVPFDRNEKGELAVIREGAHSVDRILHAADTTGRVIEISLLNKLASLKNVTLLTSYTAVDLLTSSHHAVDRRRVYEPSRCLGAFCLDQDNGEIVRCLARRTVLATGGVGAIFLQTSNPDGARGDGLAMAYRAGARVVNAEFVQFHPTTFYHKYFPNFLISEAVRGAGARLVDANGEPFMQHYAPKWLDLAPRDIVSRSIHREMLKRGTPHMYLDLTNNIPAGKIRKSFPAIHERGLAYGVDITTELVPVVPAAHYFCGGVWVDTWGRTSLPGLYAVGEVACSGVHGANRIASSGLLEGLTWGDRAARAIAKERSDWETLDFPEIPRWVVSGDADPDPALLQQDMTVVKHIMWNYVGLIRTHRRLERAMNELLNLSLQTERFYRSTRVTDALVGLRNMVRGAIIITQAATSNRRSVGCHYREDE